MRRPGTMGTQEGTSKRWTMAAAPLSALALLTMCAGQEVESVPEATPVTARQALDDEPPPRLLIDPGSLSFGQVCEGEERIAASNLRNRGEGTLRITSLRIKGRSFSLVAPPPLPATVAPGSALAIRVRFSPTRDRDHLLSGSIEVRSNDPEQEEELIELDGATQQPTIIAEPRFIDFGEMMVEPDCARAMPVTLRNLGSCSADIVDYRVQGKGANAISLPTPPFGELAPGSSIETDVVFSCSRPSDLSGLLNFSDSQRHTYGAVAMIGGAH